MKKQKMLKLTAFTSEPSIENSFSAPTGYTGEISVVFKDKNVSIHGFDGSAWSMLYTWSNQDSQYKFENTYEKYFIKSLTGQEESVYVSFFSTGHYVASKPRLATKVSEMKLADIDEVPLYTPGDANKLLTIMSDGSLAWLLINETWMIDGSPVPSVSNDPIWNNSIFLSNLYSNAGGSVGVVGLANLVFENNIMSFDGSSYLVDTNKSYLTDDFTFSTWFKFEGNEGVTYALFGANNMGDSSPSTQQHGFHTSISSTTISTTTHYTDTVSFSPSEGFNDGKWHHVAITISRWNYVMYVDGVSVGTKNTDGTWDTKVCGMFIGKWRRYDANWYGNNYVGKLFNSSLYSSKLTAGQVLAIYDAEKPAS